MCGGSLNCPCGGGPDYDGCGDDCGTGSPWCTVENVAPAPAAAKVHSALPAMKSTLGQLVVDAGLLLATDDPIDHAGVAKLAASWAGAVATVTSPRTSQGGTYTSCCHESKHHCDWTCCKPRNCGSISFPSALGQ